jgi:hypothetical protein
LAELTAVRGDTITIRLTITRPDANLVPQPVNLTGAVIRATFKLSPDDPDPGIVQLGTDTTPAQFTLNTPLADGIATMELLPSDTHDLEAPTVIYWDAQLVESNGRVSTVADETLILVVDITRATS